jgi:hypothetical protein
MSEKANFRFLDAAENVIMTMHVVDDDRLHQVERDTSLIQSPGSEEAFLVGLGKDTITDFDIVVKVIGRGINSDRQADDAWRRMQRLIHAAETATYLQRFIEGGTEAAYRALWAGRKTLAGADPQPLDPYATAWQLRLTLRPKFPRWTLDPAEQPSEYNTGFTTLSILGAASIPADAGIFSTEFSSEFA